jgi:16S rRNA (uracil1498-N3)-methyltransferase
MAALARSSRIARWERIAVSSAKQCARAVVPALHHATPLDWYWTERTDATRLMCVEPSAALGEVRSVRQVVKPKAVHVIVGPEGGWSVTEVASAHESGAILMTLGSRTLRADAVPIVALTALLTTWGELT